MAFGEREKIEGGAIVTDTQTFAIDLSNVSVGSWNNVYKTINKPGYRPIAISLGGTDYWGVTNCNLENLSFADGQVVVTITAGPITNQGKCSHTITLITAWVKI